jgi:predicted membrane channel-forming protein YqfA (hemolysin III family)
MKKISKDSSLGAYYSLAPGGILIFSELITSLVMLSLGLLSIYSKHLFPEISISFGLPIGIIVYSSVMWLAVKYSAENLKKKFVINDANKIILIAGAYVILLGGGLGGQLTDLFKGLITFRAIAFIFAVITFFIASKKYLKKDSTNIPQSIQSENK